MYPLLVCMCTSFCLWLIFCLSVWTKRVLLTLLMRVSAENNSKMSIVCAPGVCAYFTPQLERSLLLSESLVNVLHRPLSVSWSTHLFVSDSEIFVVFKKRKKNSSLLFSFFFSFLLRINRSVCLLSHFKESGSTDAIMHKVWRNRLCVIELLFGSLSERLK